ncbi:hypothetical protein C4K24_2789 [Pseudomonas chlororaphis subsp. aurantiaca]|nr:hypothetical protein C4K24_2789 [Pseudomonas chlororaphis subsp. aurantiaca]
MRQPLLLFLANRVFRFGDAASLRSAAATGIRADSSSAP